MSTATPINESLHVAQLLPATAATPEPARRFWLLPAFAYWFRPTRYGPHLAVDSWWRAILANFIAIIIVAATCTFFVIYLELALGTDSPFRDSSVTQQLNMIRSALRIGLIEYISGGGGFMSAGGRLVEVLIVQYAVLIGIELALPLLAIMVMPWCAGGDRAMSVFKRSMKNTLWASTFLAPVTVFWVGWSGVVTQLKDFAPSDMHNTILFCVFFVIAPLQIIWLLRLLFVGAKRYVGEPDGPAFSPREPQCDMCGYLIIGLPMDARCPECGAVVADSLPNGKRRPSAWQRSHFKSGGIRDFFRITKDVLLGRDIFSRLPVHQGITAARHFWWLTFLLMIFTVNCFGFVLSLTETGHESPESPVLLALASLVVPMVAQMLIMFLGCATAQLQFGIRDYRVSAIVCYYGAALMWPMIAVVILTHLWFAFGGPAMLGHGMVLEIGKFGFYSHQLSLIIAGVLILGCLAFWFRRLGKAFTAVRYANV